MTVTQRNFISYGTVAAFSILMLVWGIPAYSPEYPGYGIPATLLPDIAVGFMLALSLLGLLRTEMDRRRAAGRKETGAGKAVSINWLHLAKFLIPCLLVLPAMHMVHFVPAGIAFLVIIQLFCGQRKPLSLILVAVVPVALVYCLMRYALGVPMP